MISPLKIILILAIVVLLFGRGRISSLMEAVGKGIRSFKKEIKDDPAAPEPIKKITDERSKSD